MVYGVFAFLIIGITLYHVFLTTYYVLVSIFEPIINTLRVDRMSGESGYRVFGRKG